MSNDLDTVISSLETDAYAAEDRMRHHLDRAAYHKGEADANKHQADTCRAAIAAINRVKGVRVTEPLGMMPAEVDVDAISEEAPAEPEPFLAAAARMRHEYTAERLLKEAREGSPGIDHAMLRRELRRRHIHYPVAKTYRSFSQFFRQSLVQECMQHPDYQTYVDAGGPDLKTNGQKLIDYIRDAASMLGIDYLKVREDCKALHAALYRDGVKGRDYL